MAVCKKCGKEYDESLSTCPYCGEPFTPDIPEETFDMYQELMSTSDTKEFVMPSELLEELVPEEIIDDPETAESPILNDSIREQMVREMYTEEPDGPRFADQMRSSLSSLFASLKNIKLPFGRSSSPAEVSNEPAPSEEANDVSFEEPAESIAESEDLMPTDKESLTIDQEEPLVEESTIETEEVLETGEIQEQIFEDSGTGEAEEAFAEEADIDSADEPDTYDSSADVEAVPFDEIDTSPLFDELSDDISFEEGFVPLFPETESKEIQPDNPEFEELPQEEIVSEDNIPEETDLEETVPEEILDTPVSDEATLPDETELQQDTAVEEPAVTEVLSDSAEDEVTVDSILEGLRESYEEPEQAEAEDQTEDTEHEENAILADEEDTSVLSEAITSEEAEDGSTTVSSDAENGAKLLKKKGLGKAGVLILALLAVLAVVGVIFFYILPQKQAEQQAIEDRVNSYLEFLCDTWMSDVFIYADQEHPSREVLTLNKDFTYRCDIWTSSSDREAFDPEIWSITDTNEGTYYLELDTASLRIYYTGDDGEDYVYRRYIRELDDDVLVLREYYNETLSEYYDVTFSKYKEG
ncbi:MAG: hypothetical protein IJH64_13125 [Oscillospiraceae bacterium]|nr:hypothetical protein [Oscillospiraceae bacterium]MBR0450937.1 hypothetical protein [Oscillospiraceae bacterium]